MVSIKKIVALMGVLLFLVVPVQGIVAAGAAENEAARPLADPVPLIQLGGVGESLLGEDVTVTVSFANAGDEPGFAPYIDLYLDVTGQDGVYPGTTPGVDVYDGVSFVSASYLGQPLQATVLTFTESAPGSGVYTVTHPYFHSKGTNPDGSTYKLYETITAPPGFTAGDQLVVLRLPFGSFVPGQPAIAVDVTLHLSNLADLGQDVLVAAGGGFEFGATELDDWCCEEPPSINIPPAVVDAIVPTLVTMGKTHTGQEGETATGPNYPLSYRIDLDFAAGQPILELLVEDTLPNTIVYQNNLSFSPVAYGTPVEPLTDQPYNPPDNALTVHWVHPGGLAVVNGDTDAWLAFDFYVPERDANGDPVVPETGADGSSCNDMRVTYTWQPVDGRDSLVTDTVDSSPCDAELDDEALVLRKGVSNVNPAEPFDAPGDILRYTLTFSVSDFFALENAVLTDILSDGQRYYADGTYFPTLSVQGYDFVVPADAFSSDNLTVDCNYSGGPGPECTLPDPGGTAPLGTTELTFEISQEMIRRTYPGSLVGGCVDAVNGGLFPGCTGGNGPTTGVLIYYAQIQESYTDTAGQLNLDQGDSLNNEALVQADVLSLADLTTVIGSTVDDSGAGVSIPRGALSKDIYAVNGDTGFNLADGITPGDTVTYRLSYDLPTADVENLYIEDYLPLPVFRVDDPEADGTPPAPVWDFLAVVSDGTGNPGTGVPLPGRAMFGPGDDFWTFSGILPVITVDVPANKLTFTYGDFSNTPTTPATKHVDILFTLVVTGDPFADRLFLTNQALGYESNTSSDQVMNGAIVQILLTEPVITEIRKSAVSSDNPEAQVVGPDGGITFTAPGTSGVPWTGGDITSGVLPIDTDIETIEGGDRLRFAILIENTGSGARGAFDLTLRDLLPAGLSIPPGGLNLQIYNGAGENGLGDPLPFNFTGLGGGPDGLPGTSDDLFGDGIQIVDPDPGQGACQSHTVGGGRNIIVITYDLLVDADIESGSVLENEAELTRYASVDDGENFLDDPLSDDSSVTVADPAIEKTLVETSLDEPGNGNTQAVIGETVTYALMVTLPEGTIRELVVRDLVPGALMVESYSVVTTAAASGGLLTADFAGTISVTSTDPLPTDPGDDLYLTLADPTENPADDVADNDSFVVFVTVRVANLSTVQDSLRITNRGRIFWTDGTGQERNLTDRDNQLVVVEPAVDLTKAADVTELDAGDPLTYTITLSNPNLLTAYDLTFYDSLPCDGTGSLLSLDFATGVTVSDSAGVVTKADFELVADAGGCFELRTLPGFTFDLLQSQTLTITVTGTVENRVSPNLAMDNVVLVNWTSLDGADPDERTGEDGPGGLNDYAESVTETVTVNNILPEKSITATSEAHTTGNDVVIGETVRFRLEMSIPEGVSTDLTIADLLPPGLQYAGNPAVAFVSNDGGVCQITSDEAALAGAGLCLVGDDATIDGLTPGFSFPAALLENGDDPGNPFGNGHDPVFSLGTLTNDDRDAGLEYVLVAFDALVLNVSGNQAGDSLENVFEIYENGALLNTSTAQPVTVLEPDLTIIKALDGDLPVDAGDALVYTLTITAGDTGTTTTAFDLEIRDLLPEYLDLLLVTANAPSGSSVTDNSFFGGPPDEINLTVSQLLPGETVTVTVETRILANYPVGLTLDNEATVTWTSLPADGHPDERDGAGTGPDDYLDDSGVLETTPSGVPLIDKLPLDDPEGTIGDRVFYTVRVTLPEGITRQMRVEDALPAGLSFESVSLITTAAASSGRLTEDFNGTATLISQPTAGDTGTLDFGFGDVATLADNQPGNNSFLLVIEARILDVVSNQLGTVLNNAVSLFHRPEDGEPEVQISDPTPVPLTIIEPQISTSKDVNHTINVEAGDALLYTVGMVNIGNSTAYEVSFTDVLAQGTTFDSLLHCTNPVPGTVVDTSVPGQVTISNPAWDLAPGQQLTCLYAVLVNETVYLNGPHTNTADADWSGQNDAPGDARVYDDSGGYTVDGLQDADDAVFNVNGLTLQKTADVSQVVINGTVTYTLTIAGPDGTVRDLVIADVLPAGLVYQATTGISGVASVTPDVSAPNDGTAPVTVTWDFGDAVKSGDIVITYTASAADVASNINGTDLINAVTLDHTTATGSPAPELSDSATVTVAEPDLVVTKAFDGTPPDSVGSNVDFLITIEHAGSSTAPAENIRFTDALPARLALDLASIACSGPCTDSSAGNQVDVTFPSLPLGGSLTLTFSAELLVGVAPGETITNLGAITWQNAEGVQRPGYYDQDEVGFDIEAAALAKSLEGTDAAHTAGADLAVGETATFSLVVTLPEGTIDSLIVRDTLPAGMAYVDGSAVVDAATADNGNPIPAPAIAESGGVVTFTFGQIVVVDSDPASVNDTFTITLSAVVVNDPANQDGLELVNNATVQAGGGTEIPAVPVLTRVVEPDLTLDKGVNQPAPGPGETFTYTLTLSHTGSSSADALDVVLTDTLPTGLSFAGTPAAPTGWSVTTSGQTITFTGDLTLADGAVSFLVDVVVDADVPIGTTLTNDARVAWTSLSGADPEERDGSDGPGGLNDYAEGDAADVVYTGVDLHLVKDDGGVTVQPGDQITYHLTITNNGNSLASGVVVTETLPEHTRFVGPAYWVPDAGMAGQYTALVGDLAAQDSTALEFIVEVESPLTAGVSQIENSAAVESEATDANPADNADEDQTPVTAAPALTVEKEDGLAIVAPGAVLTYAIDVSNTGNQDAAGVTLVDHLPGGVDYLTSTPAGTYDADDHRLDWDPFDLAAGASRTFQVTVQVHALEDLDGVTQLQNLAVATAEDGGEPISDADMDVDQIAADGVKRLVETNQGYSAGSSVFIGEILTYEVTLTVPPGTMTGLTLADNLDAGLAFVSCLDVIASDPDALQTSRPGGWEACCLADSGDPGVDPGGGGFTMTFGDVTNSSDYDQTLTVRYTVVVLNIAENVAGVGDLNNTAEWSWDGGSLADSAAPVEIIEPDLSIRKEADPTVAPLGTPITFTLSIAHTAESSADAFDVVVTDVLPPGLSYAGNVTLTGLPYDSLDYDDATDTLTFYWARFGLTDTVTITFDAIFVGPPDVTNQASVAWTSLPLDPGVQSGYNPNSTERDYDPLDEAGINSYGASSNVVLTVPELPETGFAPGVVTPLPAAPAAVPQADFALEIPDLGLALPVLGIPLDAGGWDLTWLGENAGYLEGSAYPTEVGNTVITAHVSLPNGEAGPFVDLESLKWGQEIRLESDGVIYVYAVRRNYTVLPDNLSLFAEDGYAWLTLLTCKDFDPESGVYLRRVVVQAVLVEVIGE
jgi:large repetitive protein